MERYFYHGFEGIDLGEGIEQMLKYIESGHLRERSETDEKLKHICLYRKNEEVDYDKLPILKTALSSWIENCFVFVLSPDLEAEHQPPDKVQGLVDEWRSFKDIPMDKVVGIALPLDSINKSLDGESIFSEEEIPVISKYLPKLKEVAQEMGWMIVNSDEKGFTDKLDTELQRERSKSNT